jgi:hypothetical protein
MLIAELLLQGGDHAPRRSPSDPEWSTTEGFVTKFHSVTEQTPLLRNKPPCFGTNFRYGTNPLFRNKPHCSVTNICFGTRTIFRNIPIVSSQFSRSIPLNSGLRQKYHDSKGIFRNIVIVPKQILRFGTMGFVP